MQIKELFTKDINRAINGVVKADQTSNDIVFTELDEYVVTVELAKHFEAFFDSYMPSVRDPKAKAASGKLGVWVSGFFGCGKSHFIKILSYLLQNIKTHKGDEGDIAKSALEFFNDKNLDSFLLSEIDHAVTKNNTVILFNIDSRANTDDGDEAVLKVFLKVFNEQMGFSGDHPHIAHLERKLKAKGVLEKFHQIFSALSGMNWIENRDSYDFYRDDMVKALAKATSQSNESARSWVEQLESNFSLDVANFCKWVKEYLDVDQDRRVLFFVDEVGQFIGNNTQMMLKLQTITENLGTICEGRAWVVVTSQEDIDSVIGQMSGSKGHDFSKIQGRFERISLSSSNTSEVIEKRLLEKKLAARELLSKLYDEKGDILRNQLAFDSSTTAELANYKDATSFIHSYPFVPYHYTLVQKIFEAIRKAGATGLHLSRGERSLLDAFQSAAQIIADKQVGVLIPLHYFYPAIESFLDTSVKKDIDQANDKESISPFALSILKTLFLIRYVEIIKSTLDNLVTLCISQVDEDRLVLRQDIELALNSLEQNLLIARQGDEYIFLTNEEKEIEKEIQHTDIELSDETAELSKIVFEGILRRNTNYRYPENKQDFPISRFCNGIPKDGSKEHDLVVKIISPIDANYKEYESSVCANHSNDGNGAIVIKLSDNENLFNELRVFIKTDKFLRMVVGNRPEQEKLLRDKASENHTRHKRIATILEKLLKEASFFALGSELNPKGGSIASILEDTYKYVIENTFGKLKWVTPYSGDIKLEIQQTLIADDIGQKGLDLNAEEVNPTASIEVEKYISLTDEHSRAITAEDIVKRFSKRPYGWNNDEIILIMARLALANKINFQKRQQDVSLSNAYDELIQIRKRAEMRVRRVKQTSEDSLKHAATLFRDVFSTTAPSSSNGQVNEKELFNVATQRLAGIKSKLDDFSSKASTGHYPGVKEIEAGKVLIASLLGVKSSYQFIARFLSNKKDLLEFEEDFESLENFFETQFSTWQELATALNVKFERNKLALEKNDLAAKALAKLEAIYHNKNPYREIRKITLLIKEVTPLIKEISDVNESLLTETREHAQSQIQLGIDHVTQQINDTNAPSEISNKALQPLQSLIKSLKALPSIAEIHQQITEADSLEEDAYDLINRFIEQQEENRKKAEIEAKKASKEQEQKQKHAEQKGEPASVVHEPTTGLTQGAVPPRAYEPAPKKIVSVDTCSVMRDVNQSGVIETEQDINTYLNALRDKLSTLVANNNKVRIK